MGTMFRTLTFDLEGLSFTYLGLSSLGFIFHRSTEELQGLLFESLKLVRFKFPVNWIASKSLNSLFEWGKLRPIRLQSC